MQARYRAGFAQTGGLGKSNRRERHLRELRQVEQAFGVTVGHAVGGELPSGYRARGPRIEKPSLERVSLSARSHTSRAAADFGTLVQNHALLLMPWPG